MGIEWPLAHRVACHEEKIGAILGARPLAQPALVLGRQVGLTAAVLAPLLQDQLLGVGEIDGREGVGRNGQLNIEQRQLGRVVRLRGGR